MRQVLVELNSIANICTFFTGYYSSHVCRIILQTVKLIILNLQLKDYWSLPVIIEINL